MQAQSELRNIVTCQRAKHTVEVDLAVEVRVVEDLHRDLLFAVVLCLELGVVNRDIFLHMPTRKLDLLVLARAVSAHDRPVCDGDGHAEQNDHEDVGLQPAAVDEGKHALDEPWNNNDRSSQLDIGEVAIAFVETL